MSETTPILVNAFELLFSYALTFTSARISRTQRKRQRIEVCCVRLTFYRALIETTLADGSKAFGPPLLLLNGIAEIPN